MRDRAYWAARALQREQEAFLEGLRLTGMLYREYEAAAAAIREAVGAFYGKYAGEGALTYEQAVRPLAGDPSISRLEALEGQVDSILNGLHHRSAAQLGAAFGALFQAGYYHKLYDLQSRAGRLFAFAKLDPGQVECAVNYPWSGAAFSDRLWKNKEALAFTLRESITQGLIQGKGAAGVSKELSGKLGQSYKAAERVVRTEASHLHNEADRAAYQAAGVKEYEFMATLDGRTCDECGALDGKHFQLNEAQPGVNFPPLHPNDRCTTVEYDPEDAADWARSGAPMPEGMTYEAWAKAQKVDRESDLGDKLRRAAKSAFNRTRVVGFNGLPKEFREQFRAGLARAAPEAREALRREYRKADYIIGPGKGSYYSGGKRTDIITLGTNAQPSTLAHELFHRLDREYGISGALSSSLIQDYVGLNVRSGGDVTGYLMQQYAAMFQQKGVSGAAVMKPEYRGLSDILNGLSGGTLHYGFKHNAEYWKRPGALEAEAWAQFGRVQYENDPAVIKIFSELFPNFAESAMLALKGVI